MGFLLMSVLQDRPPWECPQGLYPESGLCFGISVLGLTNYIPTRQKGIHWSPRQSPAHSPSMTLRHMSCPGFVRGHGVNTGGTSTHRASRMRPCHGLNTGGTSTRRASPMSPCHGERGLIRFLLATSLSGTCCYFLLTGEGMKTMWALDP